MSRLLRAIKNRFGSTSELGIYEMCRRGLREVANPSELLLSHPDEQLSGVAIGVTVDGARPFLIEVQALVSTAAYGTPQRSVTGFDAKRMNMLLAVLEKRVGFKLAQKDVFLNIAGGLKVSDPALDLGVIAAILSSNVDMAIPKGFCMTGEVGLSGEIRPVTRLEQRIVEAEKLGMENTHFSNAHGLWAQQNYSSCKDMATLCEYAISKYQVFRDIVCLPSYHMASTSYHSDGTDIYNTNLMLDSMTDYYYSYAKGIKTGTLDSAGRCLASYAEYEGTSYLIVTMGAPMDKLEEDVKKGEKDPDSIYGGDNVYYNLLDHISLYKWAFSSLVATDFVDKNSEVRDVKVSYGDGIDYANLKPANGFIRLWPVDISVNDVEKKITVYDNVVAPVEVGDVLGKMELVYKGEVLATIDLVSTTKVERSQVKAKVKIAKSYFESSVFKVTLTILIALIVIYSVVHIAKIQKKYMK